MKFNRDCSEEELIVLLRMRDQQALAYLYDKYAAVFNGVILRFVKDKMLAEQILLDVFVRIWNNISKYDASKGRLFPWMMNITCKTLHKKGFNNRVKFAPNDSEGTIPGIELVGDQCDTLEISKRFINLTHEQRLIIDLAYFHGYTQQEIAKQMGITLETIKTRFRTANLELRKVYQTHPDLSAFPKSQPFGN